MGKKILIVFNPFAGKKYPKMFKEKFLFYLKQNCPDEIYDWLETGEYYDALEKIDFSLYQKIIVCGGDGTIKEVASFVYYHKIDLPLAIIPGGSANILANNLKIPSALKKSLKIACQGRIKMIDLGLLNQNKIFVVSLSLGHGSHLIKETSKGLKLNWGYLAYIFAFFRHHRKYETIFKFKLDQKDYAIKGNTLIVANALSIFKLKPLRRLDVEDGQLEIIIFKNSSLIGLAFSILAFILGRHWLPFIQTLKGQKIIFEDSVGHDAQVDGEHLNLEKIIVETIPRKLKVLVKS